MSFYCSISKHGQVVYQGAVRELEEVTKSLDSIGPEVIQTLSVSTIHSLLHHDLKSYSRITYVCLSFCECFFIREDKLVLERVKPFSRAFQRLHFFCPFEPDPRFPALAFNCMLHRNVIQLNIYRFRFVIKVPVLWTPQW